MSQANTQPQSSVQGPAEAGSTGTRAWPWILFAVALLVRIVFAVLSHLRRASLGTLEFPDEQQYWLIATNLVEGLGLRDEIGHRAGRMPLYPAFLAVLAPFTNGIVFAKIGHIMLGSALASATYALAKRAFNTPVAVIAGLLVAFDPFLTFFSTLLLTETPFCLALTLFLWTVVPWVRDVDRPIPFREWAVATFLAVVLIYLRESTLGFVILVAVFVIMVRGFDLRCIKGAIMTAFVAVLALFPWALRNKSVIDSWTWLTSRGGISLYDGVGPQADGSSNLGDIKQSPMVAHLTEADYDRFFRGESIKCIRENPRRILGLAVVKIKHFWSPFPNAAGFQSPFIRLIAALWTIPAFTLAVIGVILLLRRNGVSRRITVFLLLPVLYLTVIHMIFVGSIRYRLGAVPAISILAAYAMVRIADGVRGKTTAE